MFDLNIIVVVYILIGIAIFGVGLFANNIIPVTWIPGLVFDLLRYGRASTPGKENIALLKWIQVPKSWFAHFYLYCTLIQSVIFSHVVAFYVLGWNIRQSVVYGYLCTILDTLTRSSERSYVVSPVIGLLVSFLFLIHVARRFYETRYVCVYSDTKMNFAHYLLAFLHYTLAPMSLLAFVPGFGGKSRATYLPQWSWDSVKNDLGLLQWIGIVLFLYGTVEQYKAHVTYANLRKKGDKVVTKKHQIPRGGLFELISCPNYWAEILIYFGFGLIFSFENVYWNAIIFFVVSNQVTAGVMNHIWYKQKFPEYPKNRKAVIPYVW